MKPAEQLVGIVTAASQAIECWFALGDPATAHESATWARRAAAEAPEVGKEALGLSDVVPEPILHVLSERVARHWNAYERALAEDLSREEAQAVHFALLACLNRELASLRELEQIIPPGVMRRWWVEYT